MSETKTYVFGNDSGSNSTANGLVGLIAPMLQQRGIDPSVLAAMMNNKNGFGNDGSWFIIILFLFIFLGIGNRGWNNNGSDNSGYPLANLLNNDTGRELIMSAIQGNATSISQLAATLNCDVNTLQTAINGIGSQLSQVGNQVGLSSQ